MSVINIPRDEQKALREVNMQALNREISASLDARRLGSTLRDLRLDSCGPFIATKLREFDVALQAYAGAKTTRKLADTGERARRAGSNLGNAVRQMQQRIETQEQEGQRFFVDDQIIPPSNFTRALSVRVDYRWRPSTESEWTHGTITFNHSYDPRPDYSVPAPKRKPSASRRAQDLQDELWREWEQLMKNGLHSLAEYFRQGGDGAAIPKTFQARTDAFDRRLNNFSCRFWLEPAGST
ncbi:hypothetical protein [Xanthomonas indica]|uniref:Uncharacterized protein n=1 Tax=Xanthomonas indica TaxID=2912242 RepID=A0AAU8I1F9_9XANT|nr:hypothetical protein [Xanthomonas indica]MCI2260792.1 hypothetical protein [Xanthomonas indica]